MRTEIELKLADNKVGCAVLRGGWKETAILFLPSLAENARTHALPDRAGIFFEQHDISFLALNLYDEWNENARNLSDPDLTLESHVDDALTTIGFMRQNGVNRVHVIGHSLSAYVALMVATRTEDPALTVNSVLLWDGSKPLGERFFEDYDPADAYYVDLNGFGSVASRSFIQSANGFQIENLVPGWGTPVFAIEAGDNPYLRGISEIYRTNLGTEWVKTHVVPGCGHHFINGDNSDAGCAELFEVTLDWVSGGYQSMGS